jgi:MoxR-like ATPase
MNADFSTRLQSLLDALERGLVERRQSVRLCLLAALAGEHTLLIGPPGTAKSEMARRLHSVFRDARYFERLLTRFSVPEELFGPLSIKALEEDRYERHTAGFLPDASIAFIDEVFKANSAILNALLTLLNEREFDNGAGRQACPLISAIGATNEVPEDEVGEAFFDRFLVRLPVAAVSAEGFGALLDAARDCGLAGPARQLTAWAARTWRSWPTAASAVTVPQDFVAVLAELRQHFASLPLTVSDRRWVRLVWLLRVAAASEGRASVALWDLLLLPWLTAPDAPRQAAVADWLAARLGVYARPSRRHA